MRFHPLLVFILDIQLNHNHKLLIKMIIVLMFKDFLNKMFIQNKEVIVGILDQRA